MVPPRMVPLSGTDCRGQPYRILYLRTDHHFASFRQTLPLLRHIDAWLQCDHQPLIGSIRIASQRGLDVHRCLGSCLLSHVVQPQKPAQLDHQRRSRQEHQRHPRRLHRQILVQLCGFSYLDLPLCLEPCEHACPVGDAVLRHLLVRCAIPDVLAGQEVPRQEKAQHQRD